MDQQQPDTRVWFGGVEVQFVGWTEYGLVYTRVGSTQTLANLTKSTVRRLLRDGTLRVEGYRPDWADPDLFPEGETPPTTPSIEAPGPVQSTENDETPTDSDAR